MSKSELFSQVVTGALKGEATLLRGTGAGRLIEEALTGGRELISGGQPVARGAEPARAQIGGAERLWNEKSPEGLERAGFTAIPRFGLDGKGDDAKMRIYRRFAEIGSPTEQVFRRTRDAVIQFRGQDRSGSGYLIGGRFAITADHVFGPDPHAFSRADIPLDNITATLRDGSTYPARAIARMQDPDLLLVELKGAGDNLPSVRLGLTQGLVSGESMFAVGHPKHTPFSVLAPGTFSILHMDKLRLGEGVTPSVALHSVMPNIGGYSGSAIFNSEGLVMGTLVQGTDKTASGPVVEYARVLMNKVRGNFPERGFLDIQTTASLTSRPDYTFVTIPKTKTTHIV
jgi:S1-C subfamily serine protease